jgi:hypothetical protein
MLLNLLMNREDVFREDVQVKRLVKTNSILRNT